MRYIATTFPGKPVRFATASHHHGPPRPHDRPGDDPDRPEDRARHADGPAAPSDRAAGANGARDDDDLRLRARPGVLFVNGETYTPGGPVGPGAASLEQTIRANGLNVQWIVGARGGVVAYGDFRAALGQPLAA